MGWPGKSSQKADYGLRMAQREIGAEGREARTVRGKDENERAGTQVQDVNRMLKQFDQMQRMMKQMAKGVMAKLLRGLKGRLPF